MNAPVLESDRQVHCAAAHSKEINQSVLDELKIQRVITDLIRSSSTPHFEPFDVKDVYK